MYAPRRNWDSPQPPTRRLVCPLPPVSGGRGTLAGEKGVGRVPIPTRGIHCGTLYTYVRILWGEGIRGLCIICRKIRLREGNAKCRHLKILNCKGSWRQMFICLRPRPPYHPLLTHCICVYKYTYNTHTGKGGGGDLNQREGYRGNS